MNDPIETDSEGNPLTLTEIISVEDTIVDDIQEKSDIARVRFLVANIKNEREKTVITLRYGLDGMQAQTQREIAQSLGISRSYVSRIEKGALETLREALE